MVLLSWVGVVGTFVGDSISFVPFGFEVHGTNVPIRNFGGDSVHSIDPFHEGDWDSS